RYKIPYVQVYSNMLLVVFAVVYVWIHTILSNLVIDANIARSKLLMASLPPALLARLQKRGIVKATNEEVIAESYDSADAKEKKSTETSFSGAPGCPNKYNPYHLCTEYCYDHWREGTPENRLSETYLRKRRRMLAKFPLPEPWVEVYDAGIARHYYWNQDTDEVS
ncbi:hypothetical protein TELCIR_17214, partial [Teladorsagia circumcincta]